MECLLCVFSANHTFEVFAIQLVVLRHISNVLDIISGDESGLSQVNFADKSLIDSARFKVIEVLKSAKLPKLNLSKAEKRAIEELN